MKHDLHEKVGEILNKIGENTQDIQVLLDSACLGSRKGRYWISLFDCQKKSRATRLCCIDAGVIIDNKLKILIEIEESGFNPTKICGKYLTSAFARYLVLAKCPDPIEISENAVFIQIVDTSKFSEEASSKSEQMLRIEKAVQRIASKDSGSIREYKLFLISGINDSTELKKMEDYVADLTKSR